MLGQTRGGSTEKGESYLIGGYRLILLKSRLRILWQKSTRLRRNLSLRGRFKSQISRSSVQKRCFHPSIFERFGQTDFFNTIGRLLSPTPSQFVHLPRSCLRTSALPAATLSTSSIGIETMPIEYSLPDVLERLYGNQLALEAAVMELTLRTERQGATETGDNFRGALQTIGGNAGHIKHGLAKLKAQG